MGKFYHLLLGLGLLLSPLVSNGQNAVRMADSLHRLMDKIQRLPNKEQKGYDADAVIANSQQFFQLLALGDTAHRTVAQIRDKYSTNGFLSTSVADVCARYEAATGAKRADIEQLSKTAADSLVTATKRQGELLAYLNKQLTAQLVADTSKGAQAGDYSRRERDLKHIYSASPNQGAMPALNTATFAELQTVLTATVYSMLNRYYSKYSKHKNETDAPLLPVLTVDRNATWRQSLMRYIQPQLTDPVSKQLLQLYDAMHRAYGAVIEIQATSKGRQDAIAQAQAREVELRLQEQTISPVLGLAPSISLPTASAALSRSSGAGPAAVTAEGAIIDGTARFLADRLKQELNATFFQNFATILHDTAYVELQLLFPSTARLLTSGSADYSTVVQTLRGTFERDLRELLFNYGTLLENQNFYAGRLGLSPAAGRTLQFTYAGSRTLYYLTHGAHPADLITRLRLDLARTHLLAANSSLKNMLELTDALGTALVDGNTLSRQWLGVEQLDMVLRDPITRELMLGLLLERARPYLVRAPDLLKPTNFRPLALDFVAISGQLQDQAVALRGQAAKGRLRAADFVPLYQTVQRSLEWAATQADALAYQLGSQNNARSATVMASREQQMQTRLALYRGIGDAILQGYVAADAGDYGVTLSNLLDVVLLTLGTSEAQLAGGIPQLPQSARTQLLSLSQIVRYGSFMAAVAQAKTSDDVKQALQAAALPVGSASIKRRSFSSISINAFAGATAGREYAFLTAAQTGSGLPGADSWKYNLGPTAPIGLSFAWGSRGDVQYVRKEALKPGASAWHKARARRLDQAYRYYDSEGHDKFLSGSALGLFVSVIDLGVPVLLRFNDDHATTLPTNIGFRQVLAPGLFVLYHARGMPLSVFAGGQYTPQLRELRQVQVPAGTPASDLDARNSLRFNVGLTVDIPLFQLYTRTAPQGPSPSRQLVEQVAAHDALELEQLRASERAR